jgi:hypothetical protein
MIPIHKRYLGDSHELRVAKENQGLQLELKDQAIDEFRSLIRRGANTLDPQKWPEWLKDLDEALES